MSSMMFKNGISKVFHNREIAEAKKAGWTYSPEKVKVNLKPKKITKDRIVVKEVDILAPTITNVDLSGPKDLNKEGD
jgi:hypothetical protein